MLGLFDILINFGYITRYAIQQIKKYNQNLARYDKNIGNLIKLCLNILGLRKPICWKSTFSLILRLHIMCIIGLIPHRNGVNTILQARFHQVVTGSTSKYLFQSVTGWFSLSLDSHIKHDQNVLESRPSQGRFHLMGLAYGLAGAQNWPQLTKKNHEIMSRFAQNWPIEADSAQ